MSNLGVLTTSFIPPSSCSSLSGFYQQHADEGVWELQGPLETAGCYPPDFNADREYFYSPGVCPSGYTVACRDYQGDLDATTIHTCCPTALSYQCMERFWSTFRCETPYSSGPPLTLEDFTIVSEDVTIVTSTVLSVGAINAYGIEVRFARRDLEAPDDESSTSELSQSSTSSNGVIETALPSTVESSPTSTTPTASSDTGQGQTNNDGLSTGTIAGIAVGAALGGLLLASFFFWLCFRKRLSSHRADKDAGPNQPDGMPPHAMLSKSPGFGNPMERSLPPVGSHRNVYEMPTSYSQQPPVEMGDSTPRRTYGAARYA